MAELFKFRCSVCEKLLGVSPKKAGRPVHCPQCGTELIVPTVVDAEPTEEPTTAGLSADIQGLGIDLGLGSLDLRPAAPRTVERGVDELEAIAFLEKTAASGDADPSMPEPVGEAKGTSALLDEPEADPEADPDPEPIVQTRVEPLLLPSRRTKRSEPAIDRRRDVVIPRTAVVAWSLFALLALALSFVAGLLIGHYRWR